MLRSGAIEPGVRAVAIDLGSVLDANRRRGSWGARSLATNTRLHVTSRLWASAVRHQVGTDVEHRVAGALRGLAEHLSPAANSQRIMTVDDALQAIRNAMSSIDEPWRQSLSLHRFGDAYNAQALESWHVPELWFDPANRWLTRTTVRGAAGYYRNARMRKNDAASRPSTCMRALPRPLQPSDGANPLGAFFHDSFLGIYASCQKLLNPQDHVIESEGSVNLPFERLYVAYLRDAIQVLRHLRSLDSKMLLGSIDVLLRDALTPLELDSVPNEESGEGGFAQFLVELQFGLADGSR